MSVERPSHLKTRTIGLAFVMGLGFFYLTGNLFFLQVVKGLEYKRQARAVSRRELPIPAQRGEIFDRHHDIPLVVNQDSFAVDLIPGELSASQLPAGVPPPLGPAVPCPRRRSPGGCPRSTTTSTSPSR